MTKTQKSLFKQLKSDKHRRAFVDMLMTQQEQLGKYKGWAVAYLRKCRKKGAKPPERLARSG